MTWASFDDKYHRQLHWDTVSSDAFRLHVSLITECCSLRKWDGILPRNVARCAVPGLIDRFEDILAELRTVNGLIADRGGEIELLTISDHIPPPGQRPEALEPRKRRNNEDYWRRKCERGEHNSHCPPATCPIKTSRNRRPVSQTVSSAVSDTTTENHGRRQQTPHDGWPSSATCADTPNQRTGDHVGDRSPRGGTGRAGEEGTTPILDSEEQSGVPFASWADLHDVVVEDPPDYYGACPACGSVDPCDCE